MVTMRRIAFKKIGLAIACFAMTACGNGGNGGSGSKEGAAIEFQPVKCEKSAKIIDADNAPACSVHIELQEAKGSQEAVAKAINETVIEELLEMNQLTMQQAVDSFANKYASTYRHDFAQLYKEDASSPDSRAWYEYYYNIISEVRKGRNGTIVYIANTDYYEGGAHGLNFQTVLNFEPSTGKLLKLDDIFVPGYEKTLTDLLLQALYEETETENLDELHDKGFLYDMEMYPAYNFILGSGGVTFVYAPYEIAPYSEGIIELTIDYGQLEKLLK